MRRPPSAWATTRGSPPCRGATRPRRSRPGRSDGADLNAVSHAFGGVAESGTLALVSGHRQPDDPQLSARQPRGGGRGRRYRGRLRNGAWRGCGRDTAATGMPRTLNFITGPSRSADIEQKLILGAHGPRRLHIVVVDDCNIGNARANQRVDKWPSGNGSARRPCDPDWDARGRSRMAKWLGALVMAGALAAAAAPAWACKGAKTLFSDDFQEVDASWGLDAPDVQVEEGKVKVKPQPEHLEPADLQGPGVRRCGSLRDRAHAEHRGQRRQHDGGPDLLGRRITTIITCS